MKNLASARGNKAIGGGRSSVLETEDDEDEDEDEDEEGERRGQVTLLFVREAACYKRRSFEATGNAGEQVKRVVSESNREISRAGLEQQRW